MKRDKKLIREILEFVRDNGKFQSRYEFVIKETDFDLSQFSTQDFSVLAYHFYLAYGAGFIEKGMSSPYQYGNGNVPNSVSFKCLTWLGHEFLDLETDYQQGN